MIDLSRQERSYLLKEALRDVLDDPQRRDDLKEIFKEAHDEWMEKKWAEFGKWTFRGIVATLFTAAVSLYVWARAKGML